MMIFLKNKWFRRLLLTGFIFLLCGITFLTITFFAVWSMDRLVYDRADAIPEREYGVLLGTSKMIGNWKNHYFTNRIAAAVELYRTGKIRKIIVSGDNRRHPYNEPEDMRQALIEAGVPDKDILPDYAGFRTLDSVVRARNVFHAESFTVISQRFHCRRAIYLAKGNGCDAIGFEAKDVGQSWRWRRYFREIGACGMAWLDVNVLHRKPHFEQ